MKQPAFLQARYFTEAGRKDVGLVVIHTAEIGESLAGAEALLKVCAENPRKASWHYAVDADSVTQSVLEEDVAWHAPGANKNGIGIELCGRARQSEAEWQDPYSMAMLELAAELVSDICQRWNIPIRPLDMFGLRAGSRGITTHNSVSKAFGKSDHWDPGPHFPMEWFIERVLSYNRAARTDPAPAPETGDENS